MSDEQFETYCNDVLMEEVTPSLFKLTTKLVNYRERLQLAATADQQQLRADLLSSAAIATSAKGSVDVDIPLEFVKCVCKVLSVNPLITKGVENVRSQLMRILQHDDLASANYWTAPTISVVLEHVFCKRCNSCTDLDVCAKNEQYLPQDHEG